MDDSDQHGPNGRDAGGLRLRNRRDARGPGQGWTPAVIKPWPLRPAIEGGFTMDDFAYDEVGRNADLPERDGPPALGRSGSAKFGVGLRGCPLRTRCTRSAGGRRIRLHRSTS